MELDRPTIKKLLFLITFTVLLLTAIQRLDVVVGGFRFLLSVFAPFLVGAAVAFILNVPMQSLEKRVFAPLRRKDGTMPKFVRPLSLLLTLLLVGLILLLLALVVIPQLTATIAGLGATITRGIEQALEWGEAQFANNPQIVEFLQDLSLDWKTMDWRSILDTVMNFLRGGVEGMLSSTITVAKTVVSSVISFFISMVFALYILLQKEKLGKQFSKILYALFPEKVVNRTMEICSLSYRVFSSFITGQCLEAVILGCLFFITMSIFRLPYALLISCLISVTALIPIVGAFIGCGVGALLILLVSPIKALSFLILFIVLQQLEGNLIYPHVVGSSVGLPSIWVLMAVTVGGSLMGVTGMLLFIPLSSILYSLFRAYVHRRLKEKNLPIT